MGDTLTAAAQVETQGQRAAATTVRITNQRSELVALVQATSLRLDASILPDASSWLYLRFVNPRTPSWGRKDEQHPY